MIKVRYILTGLIAAGLFLSCEREREDILQGITIEPDPIGQEQQPGDSTSTGPDKPVTPQQPAGPVIPLEMKTLPSVYINTPGKKGVNSKDVWVELATIEIKGEANKTLFQEDSLKIRGRGNSTWWYDKKPYYFKLDHKADLLGTGPSKKWVLLANWMDRTILRNEVAFEAARRTSIDWTPSGRFVELYLDNRFLGVYWMGEKIEVEKTRIQADYLYSFDTSDPNEVHFYSNGTFCANENRWGAPVEVKYPDQDDYQPAAYKTILTNAEKILKEMTDAIAKGSLDKIDIDSFCDWYLVHELTFNLEPNHPKSCFFHWRGGKMYAGPVWDFDWYTYIPGENWLGIKKSLWYSRLLSNATFKARLKERWTTLKPAFETLPDYIDEQADLIRNAEAANHAMWPCESSGVNGDEALSFQDAVDRMKQALENRIDILSKQISIL